MRTKILVAIIFATVWAALMFSLTADADYISFIREANIEIHQRYAPFIPHQLCVDHGGEPVLYPVAEAPARLGKLTGYERLGMDYVAVFERGLAVRYPGSFSDYMDEPSRYGSGWWHYIQTVSCIFRR